MEQTSNGAVSLNAMDRLGPDYFSYYARQVKELLEDDFMPCTATDSTEKQCAKDCNGCLSAKCEGIGLPNYRTERMGAILRQAVAALTPEVDGMLKPILRMRRLHLEIRRRRESGSTVVEGDEEQNHNKRLKMSVPLSPTSILTSPIQGSAATCSASERIDVALPTEGISNAAEKHCMHCSTANAHKWIKDPEGKLLCDACAGGTNNENESHLASSACPEKDSEDEDDLRFLAENDSSLVDETLKKYTDELYETLCFMETQLEELLDTAVSTRMPMNPMEKRQLQRRIQKLSPQNLNRIAEIVLRKKPAVQNCDEIVVKLDSQDDVTLQRLYHYVVAVEKGKICEHHTPNIEG